MQGQFPNLVDSFEKFPIWLICYLMQGQFPNLVDFCETYCGCRNTPAASLSEKMVLVRRLEMGMGIKVQI